MTNDKGMKPQVVVVGSANTDLVIRLPQLPHPGETVTGESFQVLGGGKGANQAVAAARAGASVTFIANVGCDPFGDAALKRLRRERINTRYVARSPRIRRIDYTCPHRTSKTAPSNADRTYPATR